MADTTALKNRIRAAVKANDNQEITGPVLQQALLDIVDELNGATETEAQQRQSGDSTLQQGINSERQQRQDADTALGQRITEADTKASGALHEIENLEIEDVTGSGVQSTEMSIALRTNEGSVEDPDIVTLDTLVISQATEQKAGLLPAKNQWDGIPKIGSDKIAKSDGIAKALILDSLLDKSAYCTGGNAYSGEWNHHMLKSDGTIDDSQTFSGLYVSDFYKCASTKDFAYVRLNGLNSLDSGGQGRLQPDIVNICVYDTNKNFVKCYNAVGSVIIGLPEGYYLRTWHDSTVCAVEDFIKTDVTLNPTENLINVVNTEAQNRQNADNAVHAKAKKLWLDDSDFTNTLTGILDCYVTDNIDLSKEYYLKTCGYRNSYKGQTIVAVYDGENNQIQQTIFNGSDNKVHKIYCAGFYFIIDMAQLPANASGMFLGYNLHLNKFAYDSLSLNREIRLNSLLDKSGYAVGGTAYSGEWNHHMLKSDGTIDGSNTFPNLYVSDFYKCTAHTDFAFVRLNGLCALDSSLGISDNQPEICTICLYDSNKNFVKCYNAQGSAIIGVPDGYYLRTWHNSGACSIEDFIKTDVIVKPTDNLADSIDIILPFFSDYTEPIKKVNNGFIGGDGNFVEWNTLYYKLYEVPAGTTINLHIDENGYSGAPIWTTFSQLVDGDVAAAYKVRNHIATSAEQHVEYNETIQLQSNEHYLALNLNSGNVDYYIRSLAQSVNVTFKDVEKNKKAIFLDSLLDKSAYATGGNAYTGEWNHNKLMSDGTVDDSQTFSGLYVSDFYKCQSDRDFAYVRLNGLNTLQSGGIYGTNQPPIVNICIYDENKNFVKCYNAFGSAIIGVPRGWYLRTWHDSGVCSIEDFIKTDVTLNPTEKLLDLLPSNRTKLMAVHLEANGGFWLRTKYNEDKDIIITHTINGNTCITFQYAYVGPNTLTDAQLMSGTYQVARCIDSTAPLYNVPEYWYIFGQHGYLIPKINNSVGLTSADVGAMWKDQYNNRMTIGKVTPETIWLLPYIYQDSDGHYHREYSGNITTLTHVSGGSYTTQISVTGFNTEQIYSMMSHANRKFFADGIEVTQGVFYCDDFTAQEEQIGYDPATVDWFGGADGKSDLSNAEVMVRMLYSFNYHGKMCCVNTTFDLRREVLFEAYGAIQQEFPYDNGDYQAMVMIPKAKAQNGIEIDKPFHSTSGSPSILFYRHADYLKDVDDLIDRMICCLHNPNNGQYLLGMASGYSLVSGDTVKAKRLQSIPVATEINSWNRLCTLGTNYINMFYNTAFNAVPYKNQDYYLPTSFFKQINFYVCYFDPAENVGQVYWYKDGNRYLIYAHCQTAQNKLTINVPEEMNGLNLTVVEKTADTELLTDVIQNGSFLVNYNSADANYIVLEAK